MAAAGTQIPLSFRRRITKTVGARYLLYLPKEYGSRDSERWPLMLFLHGAGERGDDLELVKRHGPPKLIELGQDMPFIVVSPQCPAEDWWSVDVLIALLREVEGQHPVDPDRVYVTGLSMGGFATWALAIAQPSRFAAVAPICGGGTPSRARVLKDLPIWAFHGAKDPTVPLKATEDMVEAVRRAGGNVRLTVYPEAGHDSWTETYANPELYTWLLSHTRGKG